ncbi:flavin reductase family protein [Novosphingobium olei]|uniref:Flavin reductase family protein n=1 Tax=Novosphingobium olei TaxID=2728851 RepID=A0A7Y0BNC2_9SPHN|nr:flavin reductase family protein [Novosphingobium olei]NML92881.1 flavin reductase family protein [Novosphingobium olei]BEU99372.1 flavin reductase family protein [Novosphingobium olei]
MTSIDQAFKLAMRRLAASVNIVTMAGPQGPLGMAATAVCSLSTQPASLLVCVNTSASMHADLTATEAFRIAILHQDQQAIAGVFADPDRKAERFAGPHWRFDAAGIPLLENAQASILCKRDATFAYGTHSIIVGRVDSIEMRDDVSPLAWCDGRFATVHPVHP